MVHGDLKPANVMVDERGEIKILDFDLAKAMEPEQGSTSSAEFVHSPTAKRPQPTGKETVV